MTPSEIYQQRIDSGTLTEDAAQRRALTALDAIQHALAEGPKGSAWSRLFQKSKAAPKGLYMYGGVGVGKSMLMDMFFDAVPIKRKRRVHFHGFMQEIHAAMFEARKSGVEDALKPVAKEVAQSARLLCFDEMQITDITDAMIVGRLFEQLFEDGVVIVVTSNRHPDDLYQNGLNRALFLPFIDLIKERLDIHNLDGTKDYRRDRLQGQQTYFHPLSGAHDKTVNALWEDLSEGEAQPLTLHHKGRDIVIPQFHNGVAQADFHDLCGKPLGAGDYLKIAEAVRVLFLRNIPQMTRDHQNEAKRFVTLIDTLYEAKVRLIATANAAPEDLYQTGTGAFEFERTVSRLNEMQSADWATD